MEIKQLLQLQTEFDKRHAAAQPFFVPITSSNPQALEHLVLCLLGELGEFANELKKVTRGDLSYDSAHPRLEEELADMFIYLMKIVGQGGFDLEKSFLAKMAKNEVRFSHWRTG